MSDPDLEQYLAELQRIEDDDRHLAWVEEYGWPDED